MHTGQEIHGQEIHGQEIHGQADVGLTKHVVKKLISHLHQTRDIREVKQIMINPDYIVQPWTVHTTKLGKAECPRVHIRYGVGSALRRQHSAEFHGVVGLTKASFEATICVKIAILSAIRK